MKICKMCFQDKVKSEFSIYKSGGKEYYKVWCKPCSAMWFKEYIANGKKPRGRKYTSKHEQEVKKLQTIGFKGLLKNSQRRLTP